MRRPLVAGNWKMHTTLATARSLAHEIAVRVPPAANDVEVVVAPPFPYLTAVAECVADSGVVVAAQNAWHDPPGAFTGEVAVEMLADVGCRYVILGHSERRHVIGETDQLINRKVKAAAGRGLGVLLCVGELLAEREDNRTEEVLDFQLTAALAGVDASLLDAVSIAYEPVWAIGTGKTATPEQAESAHRYLRNWLTGRYNSSTSGNTRILYGGSVKPDNAGDLLNQDNVDGALVGGASLKAESFLAIIDAARCLQA